MSVLDNILISRVSTNRVILGFPSESASNWFIFGAMKHE